LNDRIEALIIEEGVAGKLEDLLGGIRDKVDTLGEKSIICSQTHVSTEFNKVNQKF